MSGGPTKPDATEHAIEREVRRADSTADWYRDKGDEVAARQYRQHAVQLRAVADAYERRRSRRRRWAAPVVTMIDAEPVTVTGEWVDEVTTPTIVSSER